MTNPRRVLIVDDNVDLAENIAEILQMDGHLTDVAASAEEALGARTNDAPDVVVTDYRLPGINGVEFLKRFRQINARVVAVVISAYTDERTVADARDAGAAFVAKPVDFGVLARLIAQASA